MKLLQNDSCAITPQPPPPPKKICRCPSVQPLLPMRLQLLCGHTTRYVVYCTYVLRGAHVDYTSSKHKFYNYRLSHVDIVGNKRMCIFTAHWSIERFLMCLFYDYTCVFIY